MFIRFQIHNLALHGFYSVMQIILTFNKFFIRPNQCIYVLETGTTRFGISKENYNIWMPY